MAAGAKGVWSMATAKGCRWLEPKEGDSEKEEALIVLRELLEATRQPSKELTKALSKIA